jgi:acyl carrier protein phosphodiesterase
MNFLAHAYLSGDDPDVLFGNFVADGIKGSAAFTFPENVQKGIRLHREIDHYTDTHPIFKHSVGQLQPNFRKYSVVIVDIYYDHFLARNWDHYSQVELRVFAAKVYRILMKRYRILPPRTKRALPYMIAQNWLVGYADFNGLQRIFDGMSRRARFNSGMEKSVDFLKANYDIFEKDFLTFFPDISEHCSGVLNSL